MWSRFVLLTSVFFSYMHQARFLFQQLISGEFCHGFLKLENTLLDRSTTPHVKICDFGYSKSVVGTPTYIAPEVLSRKEYDGKVVPLSI
ncbi:putative protein kinase CAMK-OST1L family [Helianthus anomalus]